jgi:hypothetical protein
MAEGNGWEGEMSNAVIEDRDQLYEFLATQPLCKWLAQKQQEVASGVHHGRGGAAAQRPPKNDNAELAAALSSMA